jgi:hypothetical protein
MKRLEQLIGRNLPGVIEWIERGSGRATSAASTTATTLCRLSFELRHSRSKERAELLIADGAALNPVLEQLIQLQCSLPSALCRAPLNE